MRSKAESDWGGRGVTVPFIWRDIVRECERRRYIDIVSKEEEKKEEEIFGVCENTRYVRERIFNTYRV